MKSHTLLIPCALTVLNLALAGASHAALIGYWNFDEGTGGVGATSADSSGNGNTGTIVGGQYGGNTLVAADGKIGGSMHSAGGNGYLNVPYSASLATINLTNQFTFSMWTYETYDVNYAYLYAFANPGRAAFMQMGTAPGSTMYPAYSDQGWATVGAGTQPSANAWHNIVVTWDGSLGSNRVKVYVDGSLSGQGNASATFPTWTGGNFRIAGGYGASDTSFEGRVDEVALFDSIENPLDIYNKGLAGTSLIPEPGSMALLSLSGLGLLRRRRR